MWSGEGWKRTQRQLGVLVLVAAFIAEVVFGAEVPVAIYSIVIWLLGLDVVVEGIDKLKGGRG
jgi:hypothetical protein